MGHASARIAVGPPPPLLVLLVLLLRAPTPPPPPVSPRLAAVGGRSRALDGPAMLPAPRD